MDCKDIKELLAGYIEGELPPDEQAAVEAHLKDCSVCRQEKEKLAACRDKLRQSLKLVAAGVEPPAGALAEIRRRAGVKESKPGKFFFGRCPAEAEGAPALIVPAILFSLLVVFITLFSFTSFFFGMAGPPPNAPAVVSDGEGGVYLYWNIDKEYYEQHIDAEGNMLWGEGGREVAGGMPSFDISGGLDNAQVNMSYRQRINSIAFWYNDGSVYVRKENADEEHILFRQKTEVYVNPAFNIVGYSNIISDSADGVIIASRTSEGSHISSTYSLYAQRIDENGNRLWGEGGVEVHRVSSAPTVLIIAGASVLLAILLLLWLRRGNRAPRLVLPVFSLTLFFIGMRCLLQMVITSAGSMGEQWRYILDTPDNGVAIWVIFITGFALAVVGLKHEKITNWVMVPVLIPYLLLSAIFILSRLGSAF